MNKEEILGFMPCDDGSVFCDEHGYLHQRKGLVYVGDLKERPLYVDQEGEVCKTTHDYDYFIIGKVGETVTLRSLYPCFQLCNSASIVFDYATDYFKLDAEDILSKITIDVEIWDTFVLLYAKSKSGIFLNTGSIDSDFFFGDKGTDKEFERFVETLGSILHCIGKRG
ncbi:MAG: hypothetical protein Q4B58_05950, partial [Bacteroidales bacterium]|nr:hypothetical protein [Bacteroidales bacterium]